MLRGPAGTVRLVPAVVTCIAAMVLSQCVAMRSYEDVIRPLREANETRSVDTWLSRTAAAGDIQYLFEVLEAVHPDLYSVMAREEVQTALRSIPENLHEVVSTRDLYLQLAPVVVSLNHDHTYIQFPWTAYNEYLYARGGTILPLDVDVQADDGGLKVRYAYTAVELPTGTRIRAINGIASQQIVADLLRYCHGSTMYARIHKRLDVYFPALLWLTQGPSDVFRLDLDGTTIQVPAVGIEAINRYRAIRYHLDTDIPEFAYTNLGQAIGVLVVSSFGQDQFDHKLQVAFTRIRDDGITDLIIDVRENTGGSTDQVEALISYIWDRRYRTMARIEQKRSIQMDRFLRQMFAWWVRPLLLFHPIAGPYYRTPVGQVAVVHVAEKRPRPVSARFGGNVYVLIGPNNYSSGTEFAATVRDYGMGLLVGTPTGGSANEYGNAYEFVLPASGLWVSCATNYSVRPSGNTAPGNVEPDVLVNPDPGDMAAGPDSVLERAIDLIHARRSAAR